MHHHPDRGHAHPLASEITPRELWQSRRAWLQRLALAGTGLSAWAARDALAQAKGPGKLAALPAGPGTAAGSTLTEALTPYGDVSSYNNFYEFGTSKSDPARTASTLKPRPWKL